MLMFEVIYFIQSAFLCTFYDDVSENRAAKLLASHTAV